MKVEQLKIVIAEPSLMIRSGVIAVLKRIPDYRISFTEIQTPEALRHYNSEREYDILIVNPTAWGNIDMTQIKQINQVKCVALIYSLTDQNGLRDYDETIGIFDSVEQIKNKLDKLVSTESVSKPEDLNALSAREKEILVCLVKGYTNKEIASELFLSTHTVISHRRNIARKLEIHSTAGLTIYAIMNKLVELDEISKGSEFQL